MRKHYTTETATSGTVVTGCGRRTDVANTTVWLAAVDCGNCVRSGAYRNAESIAAAEIMAERMADPSLIDARVMDLFTRCLEVGYTNEGAANMAEGAFYKPFAPYGDECTIHVGLRRYVDGQCEACNVTETTNRERCESAVVRAYNAATADAFDSVEYDAARAAMEEIAPVAFPDLTGEEHRTAYLDYYVDGGVRPYRRAVEKFSRDRAREQHERLVSWYSVEPGVKMVYAGWTWTVTGLDAQARTVTLADAMTGAPVIYPYAVFLAHVESGAVTLTYPPASDEELTAFLEAIDAYSGVLVNDTDGMGFRERTITRALDEGLIALAGERPEGRRWVRAARS